MQKLLWVLKSGLNGGWDEEDKWETKLHKLNELRKYEWVVVTCQKKVRVPCKGGRNSMEGKRGKCS